MIWIFGSLILAAGFHQFQIWWKKHTFETTPDLIEILTSHRRWRNRFAILAGVLIFLVP